MRLCKYMKGSIGAIETSGFVDGPGIRTVVLSIKRASLSRIRVVPRKFLSSLSFRFFLMEVNYGASIVIILRCGEKKSVIIRLMG